jgi:hypothetical protein
VEEFLGTEGEHAGLLYARGYNKENQEVYGFLHLTFEEYFAGRELARLWKQGKQPLAAFLHRPRWEEPILLACAHLSDEDDERLVNEFVREILEANSPYERELHRDLLLAGRCLADDAAVSSELANRILDELFKCAGSTIAPLNERVAGVLEATLGSRVHDRVFLRLFGLVGDAKSRFSRRVKQIIERWVQNSRPEPVEDLLAKLRDSDDRVRYEAARALAGAAGRPEVVPALLELLRDADAGVRSAAAQALASRVGDRPEVVPALLDLLSDPDESVRFDAGRALVRSGAAGRQEVVSALLQLLRHEAVSVRFAATQVLTESGGRPARGALGPT